MSCLLLHTPPPLEPAFSTNPSNYSDSVWAILIAHYSDLPFIWKLVLFTCKFWFIHMWIKLIFTWKALHWDSISDRGKRHLPPTLPSLQSWSQHKTMFLVWIICCLQSILWRRRAFWGATRLQVSLLLSLWHRPYRKRHSAWKGKPLMHGIIEPTQA